MSAFLTTTSTSIFAQFCNRFDRIITHGRSKSAKADREILSMKERLLKFIVEKGISYGMGIR